VPVQRIRFADDTDGIWEDKWQTEELNTLLTRFGKHEAPTKDARAADRSTRWAEQTTVDELVGPLSQEGQTQTHRWTHEIFKETDGSNTV